MTPYNHYPRVGLNYCRCEKCGNDLRSRTLSRIYDKRRKRSSGTRTLKYKLKRWIRSNIKAKYRTPPPPYKQRRESEMYIKKMISQMEIMIERTNS